MIVEIILVIIFVFVCAGDCYSTAKILRHNHRMLVDKKYEKIVRDKLRNKLIGDEASAEMSGFTRKLMKKYGSDRTMLYIGIFGYGPLCLALLYFLLTEGDLTLMLSVGFIGFMMGALYLQVLKALTLKKRFGVDVWSEK